MFARVPHLRDWASRSAGRSDAHSAELRLISGGRRPAWIGTRVYHGHGGTSWFGRREAIIGGVWTAVRLRSQEGARRWRLFCRGAAPRARSGPCGAGPFLGGASDLGGPKRWWPTVAQSRGRAVPPGLRGAAVRPAARDSLIGMSDRVGLIDVRIFTTAILIQRNVGRNLAGDTGHPVLHDSASASRPAPAQVYTEQAGLSGYVAGAAPHGARLRVLPAESRIT